MAPLPILILLIAGNDPAQSPDRQMLTPTASTVPASSPTLSEDSITGTGRLDWVVKGTIGPASLWTGVFTSAWGTVFNHPREYGDSFDGFAKRYGLRLSGVAVDNTLEAGVGAFWGEDPRYHKAPAGTSRLKQALRLTVMAQRSDGSTAPAYARFIGIAGGNAMSDMWRPDSERTFGNTVERIGEGFASRLIANLWDEYWPSVKNHVFGKH
jgi:hypothetical protein